MQTLQFQGRPKTQSKNKVTAYAGEREVFGRPIGQNQGVQFPIAKKVRTIMAMVGVPEDGLDVRLAADFGDDKTASTLARTLPAYLRYAASPARAAWAAHRVPTVLPLADPWSLRIHCSPSCLMEA